MNTKIKAKVLKYHIFHHGIYCGKAELELLDGEGKGEIISIQVVKHCNVGDVIDVWETTI